MRILLSIAGLALVFLGIYFLGQNILFTTQVSPIWWRDLSAAGSVLCIVGGLIALIFFQNQTNEWGWVLVTLGILLVFVGGRVILKPTSLWYLFLSFSSLFLGLRLIRVGRINF
jgi:hypothetical protein